MNHKPQEMVVNGVRLLAVRLRDFESLLAMRRQLGSQGPRMQALREALIDMTGLLEAVDRALGEDSGPGGPSETGGSPVDPPPNRAELMEELRRQVRHARSLTGTGRAKNARQPRNHG
ncbi:hypothetical protein [[Kitasatospora] papulosa]|uniref:hypothetical protein n=1 Tax=[Kitasatospora] papulosa TaxID=1464011 RepID=UPI00362CF0BA